MDSKTILLQERRGERGQTIILVAVSIVSLLAMASLAVDVVTLYVAKGQIQHAADAAALAGAKAFVESTITSVPPTDPSFATLQTIAQNIACPDATCSSGYIGQSLTQNPVSGSPAVIDSTKPVTYDFTTYPGNPRITVSLQRTGLPIFFARICSSTLASVSATATAEAYNPTPSAVNTSPIPIAPQCVKPILVSNSGPGDSPAVGLVSVPFINFATGTVKFPGTANTGGFIGQEVILKFSSCTGATSACVPYVRQQVSGPHNFCSTCAGATDYEQSIACCDGTVYDFNQCGDSAEIAATTNNAIGTGALTQSATQCLIHATGPGLGVGQDVLDVNDFLTKNDPIQLQAGSYSQSKLGVALNAPISTSDSIMTLPIYHTVAGTVYITGFLEVFVNSVGPAGGDLDVTILNIEGCAGATPANPSISGGGISPVPVRLITPP